jgi:hypothetical protein
MIKDNNCLLSKRQLLCESSLKIYSRLGVYQLLLQEDVGSINGHKRNYSTNILESIL